MRDKNYSYCDREGMSDKYLLLVSFLQRVWFFSLLFYLLITSLFYWLRTWYKTCDILTFAARAGARVLVERAVTIRFRGNSSVVEEVEFSILMKLLILVVEGLVFNGRTDSVVVETIVAATCCLEEKNRLTHCLF